MEVLGIRFQTEPAAIAAGADIGEEGDIRGILRGITGKDAATLRVGEMEVRDMVLYLQEYLWIFPFLGQMEEVDDDLNL